jgi:hypothetical protein
MPLNTPVLFLVFNRPEQTRKVLEQIRNAAPTHLYVAADGPRPGMISDFDTCKEVKRIVHEQIDWKCKVSYLDRHENLGCKAAVSSAIDWFFSHVEQGIILEDDCLPHPSFFPFCAELLQRYADNHTIMQIAGYNLFSGMFRPDLDYYFSLFGWSWGWATWRRAWQKYDITMQSWPAFKQAGYHTSYPIGRHRTRIFDKTHAGEINTWDYQWAYAMAVCNGLSAVPAYSLTSNIGFSGGTHFKKDLFARRFDTPVRPPESPLRHPQFIYPETKYDRALNTRFKQHTVYLKRLLNKSN